MQLSKKQIEEILDNWDLGKLKSYKKAEKGLVNHNWIIKTNKGKYVLRGVIFFRELKDIKFEIKYLDYLKNKKFPYEVPAPVKTKNKRLFLRIGKNYFWVYKFIEGKTVKKFNKSHLKQIAKMMANYHKIIEKSKLNNKKGKGYPFSREIILEEIDKFKKKINNKSKKSKEDLIFLKESAKLVPLFKSLNGKGYGKLKKYPLHRDMSPDNLVWKNGKLSGIIDFETVSEINVPIINDLIIVIQYGCGREDFKIDLSSIKFFLKEYKKHHSLNENEIKFVPDILTAGAIDDFHYQYWLFVHDSSRAKLRWLKMGSKKAEWSSKNRDKIISILLNKRKV